MHGIIWQNNLVHGQGQGKLARTVHYFTSDSILVHRKFYSCCILDLLNICMAFKMKCLDCKLHFVNCHNKGVAQYANFLNFWSTALVWYLVYMLFWSSVPIVFLIYYRGKEFRSAFSNLPSLTTFFPTVPVVALSGTLNIELQTKLPTMLGQRFCGYKRITRQTKYISWKKGKISFHWQYQVLWRYIQTNKMW